MDVLIVVDMQIGLLTDQPKYGLSGVIERINALADCIRKRSGKVIWIRHCGARGDAFEPNTPGWSFLPELIRETDDLTVEKELNDPFANTTLKQLLDRISPDRLVIAGWATDFCVDATVRSAVSNNHHVVVVGDGHTLNDRPHLDAASVIRHHNWVWSELLTHRSIQVLTTDELLQELTSAD